MRAPPTERRMVLLGPRPDGSAVSNALASLGVGGLVALVTAGREDREEEDADLRAAIGTPSVNLLLHARGERLRRHDREFLARSRERRDRLSRLQDLYRTRLEPLVRTARELMARDGHRDLLEPEIESAIDLVRGLDRHHLERVAEVEREHAATVSANAELGREQREVAALLNDAEALVIAGGHVGLLLEWLRLFDVLAASGGRPIVAWSAGAMALGERVVLFHDSLPQGAGSAEVLGPGLGHLSGVVPFPHARTRLRLDDMERVALLARRFAPDDCVALDAGARLDIDGADRTDRGETFRFTPDGRVVAMNPEAKSR